MLLHVARTQGRAADRGPKEAAKKERKAAIGNK